MRFHLRGSGPPRENSDTIERLPSMLQDLQPGNSGPHARHSQSRGGPPGESYGAAIALFRHLNLAPITIACADQPRLPCRGPGDSRGPHRIGDLEPDDILFVPWRRRRYSGVFSGWRPPPQAAAVSNCQFPPDVPDVTLQWRGMSSVSAFRLRIERARCSCASRPNMSPLRWGRDSAGCAHSEGVAGFGPSSVCMSKDFRRRQHAVTSCRRRGRAGPIPSHRGVHHARSCQRRSALARIGARGFAEVASRRAVSCYDGSDDLFAGR